MMVKAAPEESAAAKCCTSPFFMLRKHLATVGSDRLCSLNRQACACVGLPLIRRARSGLGLKCAPIVVLGRCALAARKRAARRTRRLPVSSSSCAISPKTASGVSRFSSGVNSQTILSRSRVRKVSIWQHLTRCSSGASQYVAAQVGQYQFLALARLSNHPWALRQWAPEPASTRHDCCDASQCAHETEMPCSCTAMKTKSGSAMAKVVSGAWNSWAMYGRPHHQGG